MLEALGTAATPTVLVTAALAETVTLVLAVVVDEALDVVDVVVTELPS